MPEETNPGWPTPEQAAPFSTHAFPPPPSNPPSAPVGDPLTAHEGDSATARPGDSPVAPAADLPAAPEPPPVSLPDPSAGGPLPPSIGDTLNPPDPTSGGQPPTPVPPAESPAPAPSQPGAGSGGAESTKGTPGVGAEKGGWTGGGGSGTGGEQSAGQSRGRWDVDLDRLQEFSVAVTAARTGLAAVQTLVSQMQGDAYTPKLGTSPVGQQLARKFDDRLNSEDGLRTFLAEAVRRMDEFIYSAESVRDAYAESEAEAEAVLRQTGLGG